MGIAQKGGRVDRDMKVLSIFLKLVYFDFKVMLFAKVCDKGVIILCLHLKVREVREKVDSESISCENS